MISNPIPPVAPAVHALRGTWPSERGGALGFGSGQTCWRHLDRWQETGVFDRLHRPLLAELHTLRRTRLFTGVRRGFPHPHEKGDPTGPSLGDDPARGPGRRPRRATDRPRLPRRSKAARETVAGVPTGSSEHPASNWAAGTRPIRSSRRSGRCWSLFGADEELREYRRQRRQKSWLANWCKVLAACAS